MSEEFVLPSGLTEVSFVSSTTEDLFPAGSTNIVGFEHDGQIARFPTNSGFTRIEALHCSHLVEIAALSLFIVVTP